MPSPVRLRTRVGFTVVELLVVLAIIILLVGILLVGLNQAAGTAQAAQTRFLMNSISAGLVQFKRDHGYLPPVLGEVASFSQYGQSPGWSRDVLLPELQSDQNEWFSLTSPAEYLIGYGDRTADGYGIVGGFDQANDTEPGWLESPPTGFRSPGQDGVWGSLFNPREGLSNFAGTFLARNPGNAGTPFVSNPTGNDSGANQVLVRGRVFGPYLELKDENLLGGLRPDGSVARPEDPDYARYPKVILDYWGTPIRYYRTPYLEGDPRAAPPGTGLENIFALRPWDFPEGVEVDGAEDANGDTATSPQLKSAEFALFSLGPDRQASNGVRADESEFNRDNIVEIGP